MRDNISNIAIYNTYTRVHYFKQTYPIRQRHHCYVESPASQPSVTRLFWPSHPPPAEKASAPLGYPDARWPDIPISQVNPIRYMLACQKSQRSMPCNMVKSGLTWSRGFRRRHLGRRVIALTRLRWPTVLVKKQTRGWLMHFILHRKPALGFKTQGNRRMSSLLSI